MKRTASRPTPARERLLDAASQLFYAHGVTATGIDTITARAQVAKMSLYNNFSSKDELIMVYLQARHDEWLNLYHARLTHSDSPKQSVLAVFDAYIDHAQAAYEHGFRGCGLLNAAAELPADSPGRQVVRLHKEQVENILREHLADIPHPSPDALAEHLSFLLEGAVSRAGLEGNSTRLKHARHIAETLLEPL